MNIKNKPETHPITRIHYKVEGVNYTATAPGRLTYDQAISVLLQRKIGRSAFRRMEHATR